MIVIGSVQGLQREYTIQDGDICDRISAANNVSTYQLSAVNPQIDSTCSNLVPGNQICLGYSGEDCSTTYVVVADDTCAQIAANHGFNTTILFMNNPQIDSTDCSNIYIGEVLCVSGAVQVPPQPSGPLPGATIPVTAAPANPTTTPTKPPTTKPATTKPATTKPATTTPTSAPAKPTTSAPASEDDEDDDNLPYCDEL
ncbi:hypothetical protein C0991_007045 [Blastosporella zonata]|nr:hypothetical protein C0991_007045 [Blastosporella zonata]